MSNQATATPTTNIVPSSPQPHLEPLPDNSSPNAAAAAALPPNKCLKPKRSAIFYPSSASQSNQKPFSSSAAKRESVLALGSIAGLQHLYSKQGIASKSRPGAATLAIGLAGESFLDSPPDSPTLSSNADAALAALEGRTHESLTGGGGGGSLTGSSRNGASATDVNLPPSPKLGTYARPPYPHFEKPVEADHQALRPLVLDSLEATCQQWGLLDLAKGSQPGYDRSPAGSGFLSSRRSSSTSYSDTTSLPPPPTTSDRINLVELMASTTRTIRSVRNYLLALPADAIVEDNNGARDASGTPTKGAQPKRSAAPVRALGEPRAKDVYKRQSMFNSLPRGVVAPGTASAGSLASPESTLGAATAGGSLERSNSWNRRSSASPSPRASIMQRQGSWGAAQQPAAIFEQPGEENPLTPPNKTVGLPATGTSPAPAPVTPSPAPSPSPFGGASPSPAPTNTQEAHLDPLALVRRSALDVLGMLRELEEKYRLPPDDPAYAAAAAAASAAVGGGTSSTAASSVANSRRASSSEGMLGIDLAPSSANELENIATRLTSASLLSTSTTGTSPTATTTTATTAPTSWRSSSSRVASDAASTSSDGGGGAGLGNDQPGAEGGGGGHLYRPDLVLTNLHEERCTVRAYVETVDHILSRLDIDEDGSLRLPSGSVAGGAKRRASGASSLGSGFARRSTRRSASGSVSEEMNGATSPMSGGSRRTSGAFPPDHAEMLEVDEPAEEEDDDDETGAARHVPVWAMEGCEGGMMGRIAALLEACLPSEMQEQLITIARGAEGVAVDAEAQQGTVGPETDTIAEEANVAHPHSLSLVKREDLLSALSDGEALCVAYNAVLRRSNRPWGFIPSRDIHSLSTSANAASGGVGGGGASSGPTDDPAPAPTPNTTGANAPAGTAPATAAAAAGTGVGVGARKVQSGWTFRRTENLRTWVAALRLRYSISSSIVNINGGSGSGTNGDTRNNATFDARVVARKEEGWEDMLEEMVARWVRAVGEEASEGARR